MLVGNIWRKPVPTHASIVRGIAGVGQYGENSMNEVAAINAETMTEIRSYCKSLVALGPVKNDMCMCPKLISIS